MHEFNPSEITKEIGLLDVYKASRSNLPRNRINDFSTLIVFSGLLTYSFASHESNFILAEKVRKWSELGFSFSSGILGFLIAGFTIFATVSDKSGLSYLKYNFFSLMYVFIAYLGFAMLCLLVILFGSNSGLVSIMVNLLLNSIYLLTIKRCLICTGIVVLGTWFFYSIMLLQSFIFNIYHIVMTAIRWEFEKDN
jgi:hypothetical protein